MTSFKTAVHAYDHEGTAHSFLPGDVAPTWALEQFGAHVFDTAPAAPAAAEFDPDIDISVPANVELDELDRTALVELAKKVGVKASGKTEALIERLRERQPTAPAKPETLSRPQLETLATERGIDFDESTSDAELAFLIGG